MILIIIIATFIITVILIECYGNFIFSDMTKKENIENITIEYSEPTELNETFSKYSINNSSLINIKDDNVQFIFFDNYDIFNINENIVYQLFPNKLYFVKKNTNIDIILYDNDFVFYSNKNILN